jgi:hypothetical protein
LVSFATEFCPIFLGELHILFFPISLICYFCSFISWLFVIGRNCYCQRGRCHPLRFFVLPSVHRQNSVILDPNLGLTSLLLLLLMCVSSLILQFVTLQPVLY